MSMFPAHVKNILAYSVNLAPDEYDTWILIGEPNRSISGIHWKRLVNY